MAEKPVPCLYWIEVRAKYGQVRSRTQPLLGRTSPYYARTSPYYARTSPYYARTGPVRPCLLGLWSNTRRGLLVCAASKVLDWEAVKL